MKIANERNKKHALLKFSYRQNIWIKYLKESEKSFKSVPVMIFKGFKKNSEKINVN